mmetsp:Transcript_41111/g.101127  ORF Transcript_41111/g.101127 Transcript_41111/m.101127 type:complete len:80 (+) Transcript_41111:675-914(+)
MRFGRKRGSSTGPARRHAAAAVLAAIAEQPRGGDGRPKARLLRDGAARPPLTRHAGMYTVHDAEDGSAKKQSMTFERRS